MNLRALAIEIYKCLHGLNPAYMRQMVEVKSTNYSLRNANVLVQPQVKTSNYGLRSFRYYGPKIWNMLPNNIKTLTNISDFKAALQLWTGPTCQCPVCASFTQ